MGFKEIEHVLLKVFISLCLFIIVYYVFQFYVYHTKVHCVPEHLQKYVRFESPYVANMTSAKPEVLQELVYDLNLKNEVQNWKKFGPVLSTTPIVVVQTHSDTERLQYLVVSLAQVHNITGFLLIFSHAVYDEQINGLIRSIDFCMVLQIFYHNSVQLFPNIFPGYDPLDCTNPERGEDCYERDASVVESKHHWWWTAHYIFSSLPWSETHREMVVFITENSYVLPDFSHIFQYAKRSLSYVPEAEVLSFGRHRAEHSDYDKLTVDTWRPSYERGLAFNKSTWVKIFKRAFSFCYYDDSSWVYSLHYTFGQFPGGGVVMVAPVAPRVVSTAMFASGSRATHSLCDSLKAVQLFPKMLKIVMLFSHEGMVLSEEKAADSGNGGWSDYRDRVVCYQPRLPSSMFTTDEATTNTLGFLN